MPTRGAIEDLEKYLYNKRKKDINQLAKAPNSPELPYKPKPYILDNWVHEIDNFFKILII